jgi:uncharacterized RDD family membrane protein YckC
MSRSVLIKTPENIELEYELAGVGTRFAAACLDTLFFALMVLVGWLIYALIGVLVVLTGQRALVAAYGYIGTLGVVFFVAGSLLLWIAYFVWFESRWNGVTPGKRVLAVRVINEHGYPVTSFAVLLRNLLRPIDFLPALYAIGLITIFINGNYQRIGDIVGGTIVVKQRAPDRARSLDNLLRAARITPEHLDREALQLVSRDAGLLSPDEYLAVKHFTERRRMLDWNSQQIAAMKLAVPLMERLSIVPPDGVSTVNYADFLEYLSVAYELNRRPK